MANMADGFRRMTTGIAASRHLRDELRAGIEAATSHRRREVRASLKALRMLRASASAEQDVEARAAVLRRQSDMRESLRRAKAARIKTGRERRREADAANGARNIEIAGLLTQFGCERVARRRRRSEAAARQRRQASKFMCDLTSGVAALRDRFAREGRDRADAIRSALAAHASDRIAAGAIWKGSSRAWADSAAQSGGGHRAKSGGSQERHNGADR
jgi:hypothetical protein